MPQRQSRLSPAAFPHRSRVKSPPGQRYRRRLQLESLERREVMAGSIHLGGDQTVQEGQTVALEGYFHPGDFDTHPVQWQWTAKSSSGTVLATGSATNFAFTPADDGLYELAVSVLDSKGDTASSRLKLIAENVSPKLTVTGDAKVAAGVPYQLALSSFDPGADTITSWTIDWGDGTAPETFAGNPTSVSHIYNGGANRYAILATAADEDANYAATTVGVGGTQYDPLFGGDGTVTSGFRSVAGGLSQRLQVRSDGKVLVAGRKLTAGHQAPMISLYRPDGTLDTSFGTEGMVILEEFGSNDSGYTVGFALDAYERILIGGPFGIARLSTDGRLDPTFGVNGLVTGIGANDIAVDSQHRIVAMYKGSTVRRLLDNGVVDSTFNQGQAIKFPQFPSFNFHELRVDADDRIVLVGRSNRGSFVDGIVVRLTSAGSFDADFGTLGSLILNFDNRDSHDMAVNFAGDTIIVAAQVRKSDNTWDLILTRLLDNGAPDPDFGVGGQVLTINQYQLDLEQLHVGSDGAMYVAGAFGWAKFAANGSVLGRAISYPMRDGKGIVTDSQQNVYIVGAFISGGASYSIAKYLPDSSLDTTFGLADNDGWAGIASFELTGPSHDSIDDLSLGLDDGSILVVGRQVTAPTATVIAKYNHSGQLDSSFGSNGYLAIPTPVGGEIRGLKIDRQNRIVVLVQDLPVAQAKIFRFFSDGTPDNSFGAGADNVTEVPDLNPAKLHLMADGTIVILGSFHYPTLVKLEGETGQLVSTFGVGGRTTFNLLEGLGTTYDNFSWSAVASDSQGRILIAGTLWRIPNSSPGFVARFHANGAIDATFGVGKSFDRSGEVVEDKAGLVAVDLLSRSIDAMAVDRFNRIIVAGGHTAARFTEAGKFDPAFGVNGQAHLSSYVMSTGGGAIAFDANDRIFIAGYGIQKLLNDGSPDDSFAPGGYFWLDGKVTSFVTDTAGRLVIGGHQYTTREGLDFYLARIVPSTAEIYVEVTSSGPTLAVPPLVVGPNTITVTSATPGTVVNLVRGAQPGSQLLSAYGATVGITGAVVVASAVANASGAATLQVNITAEQLEDIIFLQAFDMSPGKKLTNVISIGSPLLSKNGEGWVTETNNVSPGLRAEALARWQATGLTAAQMAKLRSATISIIDLPSGILGQSVGGKIYLDANASGFGWFVDATPSRSQEFPTAVSAIERVANNTSFAFGRIDMLTVLMHEMGHVLGIQDLHTSGRSQLMAHELAPSTRRLHLGEDPLDVDADGTYAPNDALLIINHINTYGAGKLPEGTTSRNDVNGDGHISPLDALLLINFINSGYAGANGEAAAVAEPTALADVQTGPTTADLQAYWLYYEGSTNINAGKTATGIENAADDWFPQWGL